jgi:hypothetical protein
MEELAIKQIDVDGFFDLREYPLLQAPDNFERLSLLVDKTKTDRIKKKDYRRFLSVCKDIFNSNILQGIHSIFEMDLPSFDKERGIYVCKDGSRFTLTPSDRDDKVISKKSDIQHRALMMFVFKSKLSKLELEKKFGNFFIKEGEMPTKW